MLSGTKAGFVLLASALAAMVCGPFWGRFTDTVGLRTAGLVGSIAAMVAAVAVAFTDSALALGVVWAITGAFVALVVIVIQGLGATIVPDNRGGALSFLLAFRFIGHAVGPLLWLPVFDVSVRWSFIGAGLLGTITVAAFVWATTSSPQSTAATP